MLLIEGNLCSPVYKVIATKENKNSKPKDSQVLKLLDYLLACYVKYSK